MYVTVCFAFIELVTRCLILRIHLHVYFLDRQGWEKFTDPTISWINSNLDGVVFILWGAYAQKKGGFVDKVSDISKMVMNNFK